MKIQRNMKTHVIKTSLWGIEICLEKKKDIAFSLLNLEKQEEDYSISQIENRRDKKMIDYRRKIKGEYTTKVGYN